MKNNPELAILKNLEDIKNCKTNYYKMIYYKIYKNSECPYFYYLYFIYVVCIYV